MIRLTLDLERAARCKQCEVKPALLCAKCLAGLVTLELEQYGFIIHDARGEKVENVQAR